MDPSLLMVEVGALDELRQMRQPVEVGALAARLGEHEEATELLLGRLADRGLVRREVVVQGICSVGRWRLVSPTKPAVKARLIA
jgi:predicted transcriptional regulator